MLARWIAFTNASVSDVVYVTMGGSELYDVANICWISDKLVGEVVSYEENADRYQLARRTADRLSKAGLTVEARHGDYFSYERHSDRPHAFFLDLTGPFHQYYIESMRSWISASTVRPGDFLLVTSYQGRNIGYRRLLQSFSGEFNLLGVHDVDEQKEIYKAAHPAFVLFSALELAGFTDELSIETLGAIRYRDTSPMGLYGYLVEAGECKLESLVSRIRVFNTVRRTWSLVGVS